MPSSTTRSPLISISEFARRMGVDVVAAQKGVRNGRLSKSLTLNEHGQAKIADFALAEREWRDNADPSRGSKGAEGHQTTAEERRQLIRAQRRKVNLQTARLRGTLVSAAAVEHLWSTRVVGVRTDILGLISRIRQLLPHLSESDLAAIDGLLREALERLAPPEEGNGHPAR